MLSDDSPSPTSIPGAMTTGPVYFHTASSQPYPTTALVAKALAQIQAAVRVAGKTGDNKFDKYTYSKLEDFWEVAKPALTKYDCSLTLATVEAVTLEPRTTKNGGLEHAVRVKVIATVRHSSGEFLEFPGFGEGQDRADKAIYKAITGARKYAIAGALAIPTSDDPEADEKVGLSGKGNKLDSDGNAKTKIPKWLDMQKVDAGLYNSRILALLTTQYNGNEDAAHEELNDWKNRHKYDEPVEVLKALARWENDLKGLP